MLVAWARTGLCRGGGVLDEVCVDGFHSPMAGQPNGLPQQRGDQPCLLDLHAISLVALAVSGGRAVRWPAATLLVKQPLPTLTNDLPPAPRLGTQSSAIEKG